MDSDPKLPLLEVGNPTGTFKTNHYTKVGPTNVRPPTPNADFYQTKLSSTNMGTNMSDPQIWTENGSDKRGSYQMSIGETLNSNDDFEKTQVKRIKKDFYDEQNLIDDVPSYHIKATTHSKYDLKIHANFNNLLNFSMYFWYWFFWVTFY
jgi:hypothetical protein